MTLFVTHKHTHAHTYTHRIEEAQNKFCRTRDKSEPFSGFVVDIDLQRTEMIVSDPSDLPGSHDCSSFTSRRNGFAYTDPVFTTRDWMNAMPKIVAAFNANFYDMSGHVHVEPCHESLGLVVRNNVIKKAPELSEIALYNKVRKYPIEEVTRAFKVSEFCRTSPDHCNAKGSVALVVDNFAGLAAVGSYVTGKMLQKFPCFTRGVGTSCQGIAGNALVFNGEPLDASELNPDSRLRARVAVGVMDEGRRLRVIVAERLRENAKRTRDDTLVAEVKDKALTPFYTSGANLVEMQQWCINLGLNDCINLDGGGSATMVYQNQNMKLKASIPEDVISSDGEFKDRPATVHFGFQYRDDLHKPTLLSTRMRDHGHPVRDDGVEEKEETLSTRMRGHRHPVRDDSVEPVFGVRNSAKPSKIKKRKIGNI